MKKFIVLALAMVLVLGLAGMAFAGVSGSAHDLASGSYTTSEAGGTSQVCVFCHHPHRGTNGTGDGNVSDALLWNLGDFETAAYSTYQDSGSLNNATSDINSTAPQSYLCMACHDGTIGQDALVKVPSDSNTNIDAAGITVNASIGSTMVDDHPVNMEYPQTDTGLALPAANDIVAGKYNLFSNVMQCGTCHDAHDNGGFSPFLRGDMTGSQMCLDCHTDK